MTNDKFTVNKKLAEQLSLLNLKGMKTKKPSINAGLLMYGGGGEIRTLGRSPVAGFQDRCFRPLSHPSRSGCDITVTVHRVNTLALNLGIFFVMI